MRTSTVVSSLYYIFSPTVALLEALRAANEVYLSSTSVWITKDHDRIGQEQTQKEIESAFWTMFLTTLVGEDPEPASMRELRSPCLQLGFSGCWSVVFTRTGGPASELIEEAIDAESFVNQCVFEIGNGMPE